MRNPFKWHRVGYITGEIAYSGNHYLAKSVLYARQPFLWLKTRKIVRIGDDHLIYWDFLTSESYRDYRRDIQHWLHGGNIDYIADNTEVVVRPSRKQVEQTAKVWKMNEERNKEIC